MGKYKVIALLSVVVLSSCSSNTKIEQIDYSYPASSRGCEVEFFQRAVPPSKPYKTVAKIETHVQKNFFFGGKVDLENDAYPELKLKACDLGGNAIVVENVVESKAAEFSHVHVWASVIRISK